jgi:integrase
MKPHHKIQPKTKPRPKVRGLHFKRGTYVWQPPMRNGVRPNAAYLHTSDFVTAVNAIADLERRQFVRQATSRTSDLIDAFLAAKRASGQHKSAVTTHAADAGLNRFAAHFGGTAVGAIRSDDLARWRDSMLAERKTDPGGRETDRPKLSRASVVGYLRYTQSFFSWLAREGHIAKSPFADAKDLFPKAIPTRRDRFCTKELRDRLIAECDDPDFRAVLLFAFHAGLRRQEILNVRPSWILVDATGYPTHVEIRNETGSDGTSRFTIKDNEPKIIPLARPLAAFLTDPAFDWRSRSPYLIRPDLQPGKHVYRWDWKRRWHTYMKAHGCEWVTPHVGRHTFVTHLVSAPDGPSLLHLERWTGTAAETLKKSYAHLIEDGELINKGI